MDITLGGDVIVSGTTANFLNIGDVNGLNKIALGGHSLTFTTPYGVDINSAISGAGSVVYNHAGASFATNLGNTYSGTTVVLAGTVAGTVSVFGTSTVSVSNNALVKFIGLANGSISNAITVQGVTSGTQVTSLSFASPNPAGATVTVPNITLQGATEFSNLSSPNLIIDLSGIKANNFCIEYLGASNDVTNGVANGFTNGPTGCILSTKVVTPNTAVNFISANPFVVIILGFITTGAIVLVSRKQLQKK